MKIVLRTALSLIKEWLVRGSHIPVTIFLMIEDEILENLEKKVAERRFANFCGKGGFYAPPKQEQDEDELEKMLLEEILKGE